MIHLDTNILIALTSDDSASKSWLTEKLLSAVPLHVSSIAWYEFVIGPVLDHQVKSMQLVLNSPPIPFDSQLAAQAAKYFNLTGRSRKRKTDTMIATTALLNGGTLATRNIEDFQPFESLGLELVKV
jgi:predicted nucleic acid-binding protein